MGIGEIRCPLFFWVPALFSYSGARFSFWENHSIEMQCPVDTFCQELIGTLHTIFSGVIDLPW